jgi:pyrimidine operon attenuation protein/uracil phosphoribosyltransferase
MIARRVELPYSSENIHTTRMLVKKNILADEKAIAIMLEKLAGDVLVRHGDLAGLAIIGIQRRGADLAERLKELLDAKITGQGRRVPLGKLDINLYRDDWTSLTVQPKIQCTEIPFELEEYVVLLVDDVLFTGRTIRSALEAILDYGRPRRVELLTLVDRGNRELPIQPDFTGLRVDTAPEDHVDVHLQERDGLDQVTLVKN